MSTYIDQRDAALALINTLIGPNGVQAITGQVHRDNERNQTTDDYLNLFPHDGFSFRMVRVTDDNAANAAALQDAYDQAKLTLPGGGALSATNRIVIGLPGGTYSFGTDVFLVDTEFIDFVGLGATPQDTVITSGHVVSDGQGTITKSADNVAFANLTIHNSANTLVNSDATDASAYAPQGVYPNELFSNVRFTVGDYAAAWPTRLEQSYSGTYVDCWSDPTSQLTFQIAPGNFTRVKTGEFAFVSATGTFTDCEAGNFSWSSITGTAIGCTGGASSFGAIGASGVLRNCHTTAGGYGTTAAGARVENCTSDGAMFATNGVLSGTHINCRAQGNSFRAAALTGTFTDCSAPSGFGLDANTILSGTFTRCSTTGVGFGTGSASDLSGTFIDCRAGGGFGSGANSTLSGTFTGCTVNGTAFGSGASSVLSGVFTNCAGVDFAFGSGLASTLSGTFIDCIGGDSSFGVGIGSTLSGTFTNCTAGTNSFGNLSSTLSGVFTGCSSSDQSFGYGASSATPSEISGKFYHCKGGDQCFGNNTSITSDALFEYCTGGVLCFGQGATAVSSVGVAGTFRHCVASTSSFGNGMAAGKTVTGVFEYCVGGNGCFGSGIGVEASGTFRYCNAGNTSFGAATVHGTGEAPVASGTFEHCIGGDGCFGASTGNEDGILASGYFKGCVAGLASFGSNAAGSGDAEASGTFIDCDGGYQSFSLQENAAGLMSGKMINCRLLTDGEVTVTNAKSPVTGRMENCQITVSETNASALLVGNGATIYGCALFGNGTGYAVTGAAATTAAIVQCRGSANGINTTNVTNSVADAHNAFGVGKKTYKAILNQTGTADPVATVLVNTLGGTVVWTRDFAGVYSGTLTGVFLASKTLVFLGGLADDVNGYFSYASTEGAPDAVVVKSYSGGVGADALLGDTSICIEVYS